MKILIVEDEPLIAREIKNHLIAMGYSVVGIAYSSDKAIDMIFNRNPELVILDINIKGSQDGIDLGGIIHNKYKIPFIYLTSYADPGTIERAKHTLPAAYILKPFDQRDLQSSIEIASFRYKKTRTSDPPSIEDIQAYANTHISEREYSIIIDIINGLNNKQMANKYFLSENTIKSHIKRIYIKLNTHNRAETTKIILSINSM